MVEQIVYLEQGDEVTWNGKEWIFFYEGRHSFVVRGMTGDHPYIELPDPKEEDFYAKGDMEGDLEREEPPF